MPITELTNQPIECCSFNGVCYVHSVHDDKGGSENFMIVMLVMSMKFQVTLTYAKPMLPAMSLMTVRHHDVSNGIEVRNVGDVHVLLMSVCDICKVHYFLCD
jgi:hypothetical protein